MIQDLIAILDRLLVANADMLDLFKAEKAALCENDMNGLGSINAKELECNLIIKNLEGRRMTLVKRISMQYKIQKDNVKLKDICEVVEERYKPFLIAKGNQLQAVIYEIVRLRNLNNALIEKMITFNDKHIRLFMEAGKTQLTYNDQGDFDHSRRNVFDSTV